MNIRPTKRDDVEDLKLVLDGTTLFPSEMLPDMMGDFLLAEISKEIWLTAEEEGKAIGFCYAAPEQYTDGTWNMLAIAVLPSRQRGGVGAAIVKELEAVLRKSGQRVLIVETSGTDSFRRTRTFYGKIGYAEEARIRDFWAAGDDKIVFWKAL